MYSHPTIETKFHNSIFDILDDIEFIKKDKNSFVSNAPSSFDVETSSFYIDKEKKSTMYCWGFGINGRCVKGRTWSEFFSVIDTVILHYKLNINKRLIVYVHNLSYEFQFFKNYFNWEKIFSIEPRKPIYAIATCGIEFRCSYLLSGYSLDVLGKNLNKYKVEKKIGDLDYSKIRHTKTKINEKEWGYLLNDCLVVMAHIQEEIERLGSITKIPLTKTGYVRNLFRDKCLKGGNKFDYNKKINNLTMSVDLYKQLKTGFAGGFTHANAHIVGKTLFDIASFDLTSSYPAVMVAEKYPASKAYKAVIKTNDEFLKYLKNYCCIFNCTFYDIRSKTSFENYISLSKCLTAEHYVLNNGRIVEADKIKITITEQDFFIIAKMYDWEYIEIDNFKYFYKDYLPKDFILTLLELYKMKTELKGVLGMEIEYMVSKNMINSSFGMCVTDPCRDEILYQNGEWVLEKVDIEKSIDKYNKDNKRFLFYAWGIWVTAYARRNLFSCILEFKDDYCYSDTDSVKGKNKDNHLQFFEEYNKNITEKINKCLNNYDIPLDFACPKTKDGENKQLGVWEYEGTYSRFKTLGAKRYLVEKDNKLSITIAGVSKTAGVKYMQHKFKNVDDIFNGFCENLYFPANYEINGENLCGSGKMCHTYIDHETSGIITDYNGEDCEFFESSSIHLENTDYSLSLSEDFKRYLNGIKGNYIVWKH